MSLHGKLWTTSSAPRIRLHNIRRARSTQMLPSVELCQLRGRNRCRHLCIGKCVVRFGRDLDRCRSGLPRRCSWLGAAMAACNDVSIGRDYRCVNPRLAFGRRFRRDTSMPMMGVVCTAVHTQRRSCTCRHRFRRSKLSRNFDSGIFGGLATGRACACGRAWSGSPQTLQSRPPWSTRRRCSFGDRRPDKCSARFGCGGAIGGAGCPPARVHRHGEVCRSCTRLRRRAASCPPSSRRRWPWPRPRIALALLRPPRRLRGVACPSRTWCWSWTRPTLSATPPLAAHDGRAGDAVGRMAHGRLPSDTWPAV